MKKRVEQINELFRRSISECIVSEIEFSDEAMATITKISTSNDLKNIKVFVSIFPENKRGSIIEILNKKRNCFKKYLANNLQLRCIPRMKFFIDASEDKVDEIDKIFKEIENE
ncbi:30S ribosome-binding factor RbfA [Patescibacteria group bacterium]